MKLSYTLKLSSLFILIIMVSIAWADTPYFQNVASGPVADSGSGNDAVWIDYDNDGDLDLYFVNNPGSGKFCRNNLKETGQAHFTQVSVGVSGNGDCLAAADYDGDGWMDVLLGRRGSPILYHNTGGNFTDATASSGISLSNSNMPVWGNYFNQDGKPDLYFGGAGKLYRNNGDGTFTDTTSEAFVSAPPSDAVPAWIDYDNDGYDDLFLAPVSGTLILYHNEADGNFVDVSVAADINLPSGGARIAVGDYDKDGYQDIYVFRGSSGNYLFHNNGNGTLTENASAAGVQTTAGAGNCDVAFLDYYLDGDLDLFANGGRYGSNNFFKNNGNGTFMDIIEQTGLSNTDDAHAIAVGDFDNDLDPDIYEVLFTGYGSSTNRLWKNTLDERLTLTSPNGGERWVVGTTHSIQWNTIHQDYIPQVKIEYSSNSGQDWNDVNTVPNTGSYQWLIPQVQSQNCLVRISDACDPCIIDISDSEFFMFTCQIQFEADLNHDCKVDFLDFAIMANEWLMDGNPFTGCGLWSADANTVALWHLNGNGNDDSSNNNHLQVHPTNPNAVSWNYGKYCFCAVMGVDDWSGSCFNSTGAALTAPGSGCTYPGSGDWTVEAWVCFPSNSNSYLAVTHYSKHWAGHDPYELGISNGQVFFELEDSSNNSLYISADVSAYVGQWIHIAGVYRYGQDAAIYVNGVQEAYQATTLVPEYLPGYDVFVGGCYCGTSTNLKVDEVRISNSARYTD